MKFKSVAIALLLAVCSATGASATTLSQQPGGLFKVSPIAMNITNDGGAHYEGAYVGGFQVQDESLNTFVTWCLDIADILHLPGTYTVTNDPFVGTPQGTIAGVVSVIQDLFQTSFKSVDLSNANQSAGFQLALWEIVNEKRISGGVPDYDVKQSDVPGRGNFFAAGYSGFDPTAAIAFANGYLDNLGGAITQSYKLTFYQSNPLSGEPRSQNLVSATAVPLPAAGLLLGPALAGLWLLRRRRRVAA